MKIRIIGYFFLAATSLDALTTLNVTLDTDNNPGGMGEPGDLRYFLNTMNENLNQMIDDYQITFDHPMTIQLNGILPIINNSPNAVNITIGNPGSIATVTLDGNQGLYSGFFIAMGNVTIQNMIFQNLTAKGGDGGDGVSGGGGGMGAGGAIYTPQTFLFGSYPSVVLKNVSIQSCSAVGGNGGNYLDVNSTGFEGGGGGGGFAGNGGSITIFGSTGGAGGGGFGGDGGDVTLSGSDTAGGGGGGGGGLGSRATLGLLENLGTGGSDQTNGLSGNGYGLSVVAGAGGGGYSGGTLAGGGGGGAPVGGFTYVGGGGGGSNGTDGMQPFGVGFGGEDLTPSGGSGGDGGGAGGGGIITSGFSNNVDGEGGKGGYGGGGGGGAGAGIAFDLGYRVAGGVGGLGGGGGGGGVNISGMTAADGGNSLGGGGGGGGGASNSQSTLGGIDQGSLGGGAGGGGSGLLGPGFGGGGGGGGSGLGGALFVDSNLNFTIEALSGIPTTFNTSNNSVQGGVGGSGAPSASAGLNGSAYGTHIFLRQGSTLIFSAPEENDLLTLGDQVSFNDDTSFGGMGTNLFVRGKGTVIYNGTTDYQGSVMINNASFLVNGQIDEASISVCRNLSVGPQRGTLGGKGTLTGNVFVNSGIISPTGGETLTLGSLTLSPADLLNDTLGSQVHIEIDSLGNSQVKVNGTASLAGALEIALDPNTPPGSYTLLTSSGLTGTFDQTVFTGSIPEYTLSYLPLESPTYVVFNFFGFLAPPDNFQGVPKKNGFGWLYELYNELSWTPSASEGVAGYNIYRNGILIAQTEASATTYHDHSRKKGASYTYTIAAVNASGYESTPISIVVTSL